MAESIEITRQKRPVNFRQQSTINPENLETNFRHGDDEINKIYQILGSNGIINQASVQRLIIIGGGSGSGSPSIAVSFLDLDDTPSSYNVEGVVPSIDGAKAALEFSGLNVIKDSLSSLESFIVEDGFQMHVADKFTINGSLTVQGDGALVVF